MSMNTIEEHIIYLAKLSNDFNNGITFNKKDSNDQKEKVQILLNGGWICLGCTFINEAKNTTCDMCLSIKKVSTKPISGISTSSSPPITIVMRHGERADDDKWLANEKAKGKQNRAYDPPLLNYNCPEETYQNLIKKNIKISTIISSPFLRCIQTASYMAAKFNIKNLYINNQLGEDFTALSKYLIGTNPKYYIGDNCQFELLNDIEIKKEANTVYNNAGNKEELNILNSNLGNPKWQLAGITPIKIKDLPNTSHERLRNTIFAEISNNKVGGLLIVTHGDFAAALLKKEFPEKCSANYCGYYYNDGKNWYSGLNLDNCVEDEEIKIPI